MKKKKIHLVWQVHQPFFIPEKELIWRVNSSYLPLIDALKQRKVPFSLNITGGTLERLSKSCPTFISELKVCIKKGIFTFLGSAAYHPILPFLPTASLKAQLKKTQR